MPEDLSSVGFRFSLSGSVYEITYSGNGKRTNAEGVTLHFRLDPDNKDEGGYLHRVVYYIEFLGDIIIAYESTDEESGWGFITRLDGDSIKPKWRESIPGFNVGQGLVEGRYAYLTAIGFVAKLDLDSGTYIWRHDDLYVDVSESVPLDKCCHYNSFETPKLEGDTVLFKEESPYSPVKTLKVDKRSGKILDISD